MITTRGRTIISESVLESCSRRAHTVLHGPCPADRVYLYSRFNPVTDTHTLLEQADRCVKCGLCLPHCPTYSLSGDENESPRGRIALVQGLVQGALAPGPRLIAHLDHCLSCRACEAVCPSRVAYGDIMDAARDQLEALRPPRPWPQRLARRLGFMLLRQRRALRALTRALRLYQRSGLHDWLGRRDRLRRWCPTLARWHQTLPELPALPRWQAYYPPRTAVRGIVAMFLGCVSETLDSPTLQASIRMLNRLGYGVAIPHRQGCCGALHQHNGETQTALALARRNVRALLAEDIQAVIYTATGCGAQLVDYAHLPWTDATEQAQAQDLAARAWEISAFLAQAEWPDALPIAPLADTVTVHTPCSQVHVLRDVDAAQRLLAHIPGVQTVALAGNRRCCGAAGSYMLTEPDRAARLRAEKLQALDEGGVTQLVTTNIGCALHLAAGLRQDGQSVDIIHPVVLLDRQCRAAEAVGTQA